MSEYIVSPHARYGRVPVSLLMRPDVTGDECRFYAYLTTYDFKFKGEAWPGREKAAKHLGWSLRKLDGLLESLEAHGEIRRIQAGNGRPSRIVLLADVTHPTALQNPAALQDRVDSPADSRKRTSIEREKNEGGSAINGAPNGHISKLVSAYVDDYRGERKGHDPPRNWRNAAGLAVKRALGDGESVEDVAVCLKVIAHESKNPSTLPYVLADYHQNPNG